MAFPVSRGVHEPRRPPEQDAILVGVAESAGSVGDLARPAVVIWVQVRHPRLMHALTAVRDVGERRPQARPADVFVAARIHEHPPLGRSNQIRVGVHETGVGERQSELIHIVADQLRHC